MDSDQARRKVLWETRLVSCCSAAIISAWAAIFFTYAFGVWSFVVFIPCGVIPVLLVPSRLIWRKDAVSLKRMALICGLLPTLVVAALTLGFGLFACGDEFFRKGKIPDRDDLQQLLISPFFIAFVFNAMTLGTVTVFSFLSGVMVTGWANQRYEKLCRTSMGAGP
jgi:hypothetical protein